MAITQAGQQGAGGVTVADIGRGDLHRHQQPFGVHPSKAAKPERAPPAAADSPTLRPAGQARTAAGCLMCGSVSAISLEATERRSWPYLRERLRQPGRLMALMRGLL